MNGAPKPRRWGPDVFASIVIAGFLTLKTVAGNRDSLEPLPPTPFTLESTMIFVCVFAVVLAAARGMGWARAVTGTRRGREET